jgi:hypothetical protein
MTTVKTQAELDKALAEHAAEIIIDSPTGVWLTITDSGSSRVEAWDSSSVEAWESSRVVAWESSRVVARGSSRVVARGSSRVVAWGSSRVEAWESSRVEARGSSRVEAWDSSSVEAWESSRVVARESSRVVAWDSSSVVARGSSRVVARGSSRVEAWESSRVEARGSSRVEAWGSSRVEARGSSRVVAWGSSSVVAWESSRVEASKYVAVHLHSQRVTMTGTGHVIDMTAVDPQTLTDWLALSGAKTVDGKLRVYKAVDAELASGQGFTYPIGEHLTDKKWRDGHECGGGLHFCPSPSQARDHFAAATRFLLCEVDPAEVRCIDASKLKAPQCWVLSEVDIHGDPVEP